MTAPRLLPVVDVPPKSGVWADEHPIATAEESAVGAMLGKKIDVDDDSDNGL